MGPPEDYNEDPFKPSESVLSCLLYLTQPSNSQGEDHEFQWHIVTVLAAF